MADTFVEPIGVHWHLQAEQTSKIAEGLMFPTGDILRRHIAVGPAIRLIACWTRSSLPRKKKKGTGSQREAMFADWETHEN